MTDTRTCPPCTGDCNQGRECSAAMHERQEPLPPPFTTEEHLQTVQSAWNGLTVSLAIVCAIFAGVLVVHAAARAGWLP